MNEEKRAQVMAAIKKMEIDPLKPDKMCCSCGENITGHDERYVISVGRTMCARCFFISLGYGKGNKE